jgi:hypothetical protein
MNIHGLIYKTMKHLVLIFVMMLIVSGNALSQTGFWADYADKAWKPGANNKLSTGGQLAQLAALVNDGRTFADTVFSVVNDIDLSAHYWTPIGQERATPFCGIFDGQTHTVSGLKINNTITDYGDLYSALFGRLGGKGELRNVVLAGGEVKGGMGDGAMTAALVAEVSPGEDGLPIRISRCHNLSVKVTTGSGARGGRIGGLIAVVRTPAEGNASASVIIEGCGNKASVNGVSTSNYTGGLIGWLAAGTGSLLVTDCYADAEVSGGKDCTGGLIGRMQAAPRATALLTKSASTGKVMGGEGYTGGLVGHLIAPADASATAAVRGCTSGVVELTGSKTFTGIFTGKNDNGVADDNREVAK